MLDVCIWTGKKESFGFYRNCIFILLSSSYPMTFNGETLYNIYTYKFYVCGRVGIVEYFTSALFNQPQPHPFN